MGIVVPSGAASGRFGKSVSSWGTVLVRRVRRSELAPASAISSRPRSTATSTGLESTSSLPAFASGLFAASNA